MKYRIQLLSILTLLLLDGCAGLPIPSFGAETETPFAPTPTLIPVSTVTPAPTPTPSPTVTVTPTPTLFLTPTETPENFVLAENGYDIANVRLSYPREDMLVIDFEYRLDESIESKSAFILMELPRRCQDAQSSAFSQVEELVGEGQITFKTTLQGECLAESFELVVWPLFENGGYSGSTDPAYRETIRQPFYLVRNFPTMNKDVLTVRSFDYRGTGEWSGIFSFEYSIADTIPIPPEEHYFSITGVGNEDCDFSSQGPVLTEHAGIYEIPIDLSRNVYAFSKQSCLDGFTSHSYATLRLFLIDQLAGSAVVFQSLNFPIKIWKAP